MKGYRKLKPRKDGSFNLKAGLQYMVFADCAAVGPGKEVILSTLAIFEKREEPAKGGKVNG